jgi:hypothetical protein
MKHIFIVHSPITFFAAYAAIKYLRLNKGEVIVISSNYKVPMEDFKVIPSFVEARNKNALQKMKYYNVPKSFDAYLNLHLYGQDFIAYIDLMSYYQKILVTHTRCREFHFIEEGNSSYANSNDLETLTWDKRQNKLRVNTQGSYISNLLNGLKWAGRGYTNRFLALPYAYDNYQNIKGIKYFTFSNKGFPLVETDQKRVLDLKNDDGIGQLSKGLCYENALLWVDGANERFTGLDLSYYHKAIDLAIEKLATQLNNRKIVIKLRPGLKEYSGNYLFKALRKANAEVEVMRDDIILEAVFLNSKNCTVLGNLSSALFYASIFGHHSYSIYSLYSKKVKTIFDDMPGFWENVGKLEGLD